MESAKILVSKDRATRLVSAHVVPLKGAAIDWVIQQCARDLQRLGHVGQVTLEFDQEPAIVDALKEIANPSWVSWNAVRAFAGCRFTVERVH